MTSLGRADRVLQAALDARAFSAVSAEVGRTTGPLWQQAAGRLAFHPSAAPVSADTAFDLASLTKVLATATLTALGVSRGRLDIETAVSLSVPEWSSGDRAGVTLRDLLEHCSGLPAHRPYFRSITGREAYRRAISHEPLEYLPRTRAIYSDLGFILAGFILEQGDGRTLDQQFDEWRRGAGIRNRLGYHPPADLHSTIAFTEQDPWRGRLLQGEVQDENAAALGGVAAHAGLFGTAAAVGEAAQWWMRLLAGRDDARTGMSASIARSFTTRSTVPGSSRAIGWDTMLPTSSCGTRLSARAFGHTGFTGTSLWIDPEQDVYMVLLSNRVHPSRENDRIRDVRRAFHDAVVADLNAA